MRKNALTLLVALLATCLYSQQSIDSVRIKYSLYIDKADLSRHLHVLASDDYQGRETGKKGQKMAAQYLTEQFRSFGIQPLPDSNTYYQPFQVIEQYPTGKISIAGKQFDFMNDFFYFPGIKDTSFSSGEIVFAGYGIEQGKYSDYSGIDVSGKSVLIFSGEPLDQKGRSKITGKQGYSDWSTNGRKKIQLAEKKGISILFIVLDDFEKKVKDYQHYIDSPTMYLKIEEDGEQDGEKNKKGTQVVYVSSEMARALISSDEIETWKQSITRKNAGKKFTVTKPFEVEIRRKKDLLVSENVLAVIPGTDLKDEYLFITAHYDHIGVEGQEVFNGADDDGSGTVALLEIAEAFQKAVADGNGPRRTVVIMPVSGEEKGLLGSFFYSRFPVFPLKNTVANLNIDMIGRRDDKHLDNPNYIYVIGSDMLSSDLHKINEEMNTIYSGLELDYTFNDKDDPNRYYYRSDHYNFAKKGIPVIFYFNGVHADYHKSTDTVEKIEFEKMEKITRHIFFTAWEIANRDQRPVVDKKP